jgi:glycogen operon protein
VVQLLLGSDDGHVDGLVVVNGGVEDVKVTLPPLNNADGTGHRLFELRLTTSGLHDRRQGVRVASGERDVVQAHTINIYRV